MSEGLQPDFPGDETLMSRFPIHRACRDGDVGALVSLLQQPPNRAHLSTEDSCCGWTPLHWAAHRGQLECVVRLVQMGCEVNTVTSRFHQTPTHTAAFGGHPHCVVWLTQAGADVNRQDFLAGKLARLRNASGQTAAELAHAHGFLDCFCLISKTKKHLQQCGGLHVNGVQNGNGAPCGQGLLGRKRLLAAVDAGHMKKARGPDNVPEQMQSSEGEELESMNMELNSDDDTKAITNGHHHTLPYTDQPPKSIPSPLSPPAAVPAQHSPADMCGSLHLTGSPSSCVSHRPAWRRLMGADGGDFLHYGHFHGFGDTAEELSDGGVQAEHRSKIQLYHES